MSGKNGTSSQVAQTLHLRRLEAEAAAVSARVRLEGKARHAVKSGPVYRLGKQTRVSTPRHAHAMPTPRPPGRRARARAARRSRRGPSPHARGRWRRSSASSGATCMANGSDVGRLRAGTRAPLLPLFGVHESQAFLSGPEGKPEQGSGFWSSGWSRGAAASQRIWAVLRDGDGARSSGVISKPAPRSA